MVPWGLPVVNRNPSADRIANSGMESLELQDFLKINAMAIASIRAEFLPLQDAIMLVSTVSNRLTISLPKNAIPSFSLIKNSLSDLALYRLGARTIRVMCEGKVRWDYNTCKSNDTDMKAQLLDRPVDQNATAPTSGFDTGWISLQSLAESLSLTDSSLSQQLEEMNVPLRLKAGTLGLSSANAQNFIQGYYTQRANMVCAQLQLQNYVEEMEPSDGGGAGNSDMPFAENGAAIESAAPTPEVEADSPNPSTGGSVNNPPAESLSRMRFPTNYKPPHRPNGGTLEDKYDRATEMILQPAGRKAGEYAQRFLDGKATQSWNEKVLASYPNDPDTETLWRQSMQRFIDRPSD